MDSSAQPGRLSNLPDVLLILIISSLPFKVCVKTSVLSKRWRYLYRETRKVAFKESDFVTPSVRGIHARIAFVDFACRWVATIDDKAPIDSFEINMPRPEAFMGKVMSWIAFAVGKKVKNLVLDFKHPNWRNFSDVTFQEQYKLVFEIPESVYNLTTLESLKVYACKNFEPWRFSNPGILKTLSLGWMRLPNLESFLSVSSSLLSLSINDCWAHNVMKIVGNIRELAIENCKFPVIPCSFRLPRVEIFRYSGVLCCLQFNTINANIKEVYLDFGAMGNHHRLRDSDIEKSIVPCYILNGLRSIRTLTVCHYLLQVIKTTDHWLNPVKTQYLVLKTKLHPREFDGIRFLLNNCPDLEMLIFDLFPANSIEMASSCAGIDPQTYWMQNITYNCMRKTLKVVVVKNFLGGLNELNVVKYIRYCVGKS